MKNAAALFLLMCSVGAFASTKEETRSPDHKPVSGVYMIYGGGLGDVYAPSPRDKKVMFSLSGKAARDLFDSIGPDKKDECTAGKGIRVRNRDGGNLFCMRGAEGEYNCNFGFDLTTGKSIGGIVC